MSTEADIKVMREAAAAEADAATALLELLGRDLALGASGVLRCLLWTLLSIFVAGVSLLLLVASAVALGLWLGLAWPWALLSGALAGALVAAGCARLARERLHEADLSATRRQLRALLASFAGEKP
ncbi:hypothetical protein [Pseudomarimonas salicorniae]|uniref:Holin-X, holin superfamily III n=1 Tax=Pseudomarimonas salicorniae TaxID=2933270 RepID=A0ABT0GGU5_9GAMM|nr:hypothetical protein [Lysobacter sp. CAU 1642]MCK7593250.1 hypothetical protein [Lysobacter sp. CAU 1642]